MAESSQLIRGLEGVVAAETELCDLDGTNGRLAYRAHHRIRNGQEPLAPMRELSLAANFLYMLTGKKPSEVTTKAFDVSLVLYAEHELNASTFTTRVIAATLSDMHSAVAGGVGALKGTLHGGAGEAVMRTLMEIGSLDKVDAFVDKAFAEKRRFMGMGHRVYTAGDPRP